MHTHTLPLSLSHTLTHPPIVHIEVREQLQFFPSTNPVCRAWQQKVTYRVILLALPKQMLNSVLLPLHEHIGGHACLWWMCGGQRQLCGTLSVRDHIQVARLAQPMSFL